MIDFAFAPAPWAYYAGAMFNSIVLPVLTSLLASFVFWWAMLAWERKKIRANARRFYGLWQQWSILNGKPASFIDCMVKIESCGSQRPGVLYVTGIETKGDVWEGEAVIDCSAPNRATLSWSYTKPSDRAWSGTYELVLESPLRINVTPDAVTLKRGQEPHLFFREQHTP
ncbi:MAG: hypothetical protein AABZ53_08140 [Planctomycetota bacterium]